MRNVIYGLLAGCVTLGLWCVIGLRALDWWLRVAKISGHGVEQIVHTNEAAILVFFFMGVVAWLAAILNAGLAVCALNARRREVRVGLELLCVLNATASPILAAYLLLKF